MCHVCTAGKCKPARVERGRLYYGDKTFNRSDFVLVRSELSEAEFSGKIVTIHDNEVRARFRSPQLCGRARGAHAVVVSLSLCHA